MITSRSQDRDQDQGATTRLSLLARPRTPIAVRRNRAGDLGNLGCYDLQVCPRSGHPELPDLTWGLDERGCVFVEDGSGRRVKPAAGPDGSDERWGHVGWHGLTYPFRDDDLRNAGWI